MKKTKKLSAMLLASVITAGTVSSLSAGAIDITLDKDELAKKVESYDCYIPEDENYLLSSIYLNKKETAEPNGTHEFLSFNSDYYRPNKVNITINKSDFEKTEAVIKEILPEAVITQSEDEKGTCSVSIAGIPDKSKLSFDEAYKKEVTLAQAADIHAKLSEVADIQSFNYEKFSAFMDYGNTNVTDFDINPYDDKIDENVKKLEDYIAGIDFKCHVEIKELCVAIIPDEEVPTAELAELSRKIQDDLGFQQFIFILCSDSDAKSTLIDLHTNVKGDANDDGKLALSDAIAILQTVGNPDTYGLTAQGEYNADIAGDSDGITNLDALAIQRRLLKLE
ncbi:MAG: hypothetical protein IKK91_07310 [Ruminococcus sp.]|nr:hypothetical protein [Ruminococcus sp.]